KEPYEPGLGEFMTATQLRHAKLWFAGKQNNWDLAAYEIDEIKEGLEDAARLHYQRLQHLPRRCEQTLYTHSTSNRISTNQSEFCTEKMAAVAQILQAENMSQKKN